MQKPARCKEKGWVWLKVSPFKQDTLGFVLHEDTPEEEFVPPSFKWTSRITAMRSDGEHFVVFVTLFKDDVDADGRVSLALVNEDLANGLETLETYRNCGCPKNCEVVWHRN